MTATRTVGVVVGRFQVPQLHHGHRHLISEASRATDELVIVLGSARSLPTEKDPLSFASRKAMVEEVFPNARIVELFDHLSDAVWSQELDVLIAHTRPNHRPILFGSRHSFIPQYRGSHETRIVEEIPGENGTAYRDALAHMAPTTADVRRGIIHAHVARPPVPYPAVDIAVVDRYRQCVLLGEKRSDGGAYRFIGGFFDPTKDKTFEQAARRELHEEVSPIETADLHYLGSHVIDDWRYRGKKDCIVSTFFVATYVFGAARAQDDLDAVHWVPYHEVCTHLASEHRHFGEILIAHLNS